MFLPGMATSRVSWKSFVLAHAVVKQSLSELRRRIAAARDKDVHAVHYEI
jgi:hypothetical protein